MNNSQLSLSIVGVSVMLAIVGCNGSSSQAQNEPPVISSTAAVTVDEDTVVPLSFTVNDRETSLTSLTVTANSSDATIVPAANIVLGGSGANRTVTVTPLPDVVGTTTITVTVTDGGGLAASTTIPVTFREVRLDFPTYSRQAFVNSTNSTAVTVQREKFNFTGDNDNGYVVYRDLIGP
ncbi:MAG TPA: Ig-like domain-containing protein [Steroidobacteraceae bacterium]|nr:Ig-like domain-containing protein [Steroidobacteraceae bacterium]